jgi:hypothetical protein
MRTVFALALAGCGASSPAPQRPTDRAFGTAAPYSIVAMPEDGRWAVVCEARADTDKDGKIAVYYTLHGEETGDTMVAYYIDPEGREQVVDNVLAYTARWLAVVEHGKPTLIDTQTGKRATLTGTLPEFRLGSGMRRWRFDPSGEHLLFFRDGAPVVRTLATGAETKIAPKAWRAEWSADGSWVELEVLEGDTNHDGFTLGPNFAPIEGIPGQDCGRKFDWGSGLLDIDPTSEHIDAALASLENPDTLTPRLWRLSDGFAIAGAAAVDRDTIITRTADNGLAIGPVGAAGAPLAHAGCELAGVSPPLRAALVTCPDDDETTDVFWYRDGRIVKLDHVEDPRSAHIGAGLFSIGNVLGNMRTGEVIARAKFVWLSSYDDEHAYIMIGDGAELRWGADHRIVFAKRPDDWMHAGHYFLYDTTLLDLRTGAKATVPAGGIRMRSDGAVLLDGGSQKLGEDERGPRIGPLRWYAPR